MSNMKLVYFDARGRAEPIRLTLVAAGKKFDDDRYAFDKAAGAMASSPYGQLPYLEYNGKKYGESKAIACFVARECGMAGKNNVETMRVEEVFCLVVGVLESMGKAHFEKDATKKAELEKTLVEETIPKRLGFFERLLKDNGCNGYFVGSSLTLADMAVYDITESLLGRNPKVLDQFPEVVKMRKSVESNAYVKAYLSTRKPTSI